jgi:hypothetical protein
LQRRINVQRPDDGDNGPLGHVAGAIVLPEIIASQPGQIGFISDAPAPDPVLIEHQFVQGFVGYRRGVIKFPFGFLDDDLQFAAELVGIDQGVAQGIGLDVERSRQAAGRQHRVIVGVVVGRAGVQVAAGGLGLPRNGAHPAPRRALEEHVLEHVRDSAPPVRLVEESGLDVSNHRHRGGRGLLLHQERESVGQHLPPDIPGPALIAVGRHD